MRSEILPPKGNESYKQVTLIGTSFTSKGYGVPFMNSVFYEYLRPSVSLYKLDILEISKRKYPRLNPTVSRNLTLLQLGKYLEGRNIHIMHPQDICMTLPIMDISKGARKRIVTFHDFYPFLNDGSKGPINRVHEFVIRRCYYALRTYDFIFATTEESRLRLVKEFGVEEDKIAVQGPIIGYEFSPRMRRKDDGVVRIGYINNFNWNKLQMLRYFINTFKEIKSGNLEFVIYGGNFPLSELIRDDRRIKYLGFVPDSDLPDVLSDLDVFLSTSTHEGFGIPIAKAKAMKVPVLCYDGDIPDITKRNTIVWTEGNLREIIDSAAWSKTDVDKGYSDISSLRPETVIKQTLSIYDRIFDL